MAISRRLAAAGLPTLIGSLPLNDHQEALRWIFASVPQVPLWPQLPGRLREGMLRQFVEGFPGIVEDEERVIFNTRANTFDQELLAFYEDYLKALEDPARLVGSRFETSMERAAGLYALREALRERSGLVAVKGQITGPFTLLTGLHDQDGRAAYFDPALRDMAVKGLALKAAWQVHFFAASRLPVLVFIDEPGLAGLGSSAFVGVSRADVSQDLGEVIGAIHGAEGLAGIHICGNTDWGVVLSLPIDVLSFDAFTYFDRLAMFRVELSTFLARGGILAWGLVPTGRAEDIAAVTVDGLSELWRRQAGQLVAANRSLSAILGQTLITPSCGTGSLTPELARKVLDLTRDVSARLRQQHGVEEERS
ncbi:MAG: hypothetical protein AB1634_13275 [Thermodesulfobacteriota bacterium]